MTAIRCRLSASGGFTGKETAHTRAWKPLRASVFRAALLLICFSCQTPAIAEQKSPDSVVAAGVEDIRNDLTPQIKSVMKKYSVPGLSLVVVRGKETLWAEGFGYADKGARRPATPDTVYRAGSLAKPFTAIAVMQLASAGKINIDKPLNRYFPQLSIRSRFETTTEPLTVRSVMTHHSGLPENLNKGMWTSESFTSVAARLNEEYLAFPPKLVFSYSNLGYTLLGHMVQKISGTPYAEYMEDRIFDRWDMTRTGMRLRSDMPSHLSEGYRNGRHAKLLPIRDQPALGLHTSARDLGKFMGAVLSPETSGDRSVLSSNKLQSMFEPQNLDVPLDLDLVIGLGWFLERGSIPGAVRVVRHGGTTLTFGSELILLPEQKLGVAVLANSHGSRAIVSRLAEEILTRLLKNGAGAPSTAKSFQAKVKRDIEKVQLAKLEGSYATDFGLIAIRPSEEELCACLMDQTFDVIPYPGGWFGIAKHETPSLPSSLGALGEMRFQTQRIDGREVIVARNGARETVLGEKIPLSPVPEVWVKRVGKYKLLNPDKGFPLKDPRLNIQDGQLSMSYRMPLLSDETIQVPLRPISDTEAIILGLGRTRGETLRAFTVNGEERLRYSGFIGSKRRF